MRKIFLTLNNTLIILVVLAISFVAISAQENNIYKVTKTFIGQAQKFGDKNDLEYKVIENNEEKYSINMQLDYDVPLPSLKVFSDGSGVLINSFEASLIFYNNSGEVLLKSNILKEMNIEYERSIYSSISGEYLIIVLSEPYMDYSLVRMYNNLGQTIRQFHIKEKHVNGLFYSHTANLIAISVYNWLENKVIKSASFYNSRGEQIAQAPHNFTKGSMLENKNIFMGYTNNDFFMLNLNDNNIDFRKSVVNDEMILLTHIFENEVILVTAKNPFLEKGRWYFQNPLFTHHDLNGKVIRTVRKKSPPFADYEWYKTSTQIVFKTENKTFKINK